MCYEGANCESIKGRMFYFVRNSSGMVPLPNSMPEAITELPKYFEFGFFNTAAIEMLDQAVVEVNLITYFLVNVSNCLSKLN